MMVVCLEDQHLLCGLLQFLAYSAINDTVSNSSFKSGLLFLRPVIIHSAKISLEIQ